MVVDALAVLSASVLLLPPRRMPAMMRKKSKCNALHFYPFISLYGTDRLALMQLCMTHAHMQSTTSSNLLDLVMLLTK
jgi:hypothetical protein